MDHPFFFITHGFGLGIGMILSLYIFYELKPGQKKNLILALSISSIGSLLLQILSVDHKTYFPEETWYLKISKLIFFFLQASITYFYWLLSKSIFDANFRMRPFHYSILFFKLTITIFIVILVRNNLLGSDLDPDGKKILISFYPILFNLILLILGFFNSIEASRKNLNHKSLSTNLILIGFFFFLQFVFRVLFLETDYKIIEYSIFAFSDGIIGIVCFYFLERNISILNQVYKSNGDHENSFKNIHEFYLVFIREKIYLREGLTIGELASKLNTKEYILRRYLRDNLNFQNFNEMVNLFRISEACEIIKNSSWKSNNDMKLSEYLGFSSGSAFNRYFKMFTGLNLRDYKTTNPEMSLDPRIQKLRKNAEEFFSRSMEGSL